MAQTRPTRRKLDRQARNASIALAASCMLLAITVLVGWVAGIELFKRVQPNYVAMVPTTAACFLLIGGGLILRLRSLAETEDFRLGIWTAWLTGAIVLTNLAVSLLGPTAGLDELLMRRWTGAEAMAVGTEVEFAAATYCLLALSKERYWHKRAYSLTATTALVMAGAVAIGYLFASDDIYKFFVSEAMALPASVGFLLLNGAFLLAQPRDGWVSVLLGRGSGSARARRLFPIAMAAPLALCFAALVMTEIGMFSANFRLAVVAIAMMTMSGTIVVLNAREENAIERLARRDPLTGLGNRTHFNDHLARAIAHAAEGGGEIGLVLVDIDHFKAVNDAFGHPVGDRLLCAVADRLSEDLAPEDTVARIGGDEFAAILANRRSREEIERDARKLAMGLSRAVTVDGKEMTVTSSLGVASFPRNASDAGDLVRSADLALYEAKDGGRSRLNFYQERIRAVS